MRIKELADLTGTTVRTIRYYHQIGLLPVPGVQNGWRHYDLAHVARLSRIRWLCQAGVPLSRIEGMLEVPAGRSSRDSALIDLRATVVALDDQVHLLREQRDRVRRLIDAVQHDDQLSPMPASVARFYGALEARAPDDAVRRAIRRERDFLELAFYRGDMPGEVGVLYEGLGEAGLAESLTLFDRIAQRTDRPLSGPEIDQAAAAVVARIRGRLGPRLPGLARSLDLERARRAADLYVRLATGPERPLQRAIADALLTALQEARHDEPDRRDPGGAAGETVRRVHRRGRSGPDGPPR